MDIPFDCIKNDIVDPGITGLGMGEREVERRDYARLDALPA